MDENENDILDTEDSAKCLMYILLTSFIICQVLYFIELIVLSAFHSKSKSMEKSNDPLCEFSYFTRVYRDLIIVGYIFFFILIIFYIILLIFYDKLGNNARNRLENLRFCKICDDCIIAGCKNCTEIFKTMSDEELKQFHDNELTKLDLSNKQKDEYIENLKKYKNNLEDLNGLITQTTTGNNYEEEMQNLNLFPIILNKS